MYGEQGEVEYGGDNKNKFSQHYPTDDLVNQFFQDLVLIILKDMG